MPVILATGTVEFEKIIVPSQSGQESFQYSIAMEKIPGMLAHICHLRDSRELKIRGSWSSQPGQKAKPYLQYDLYKKGWLKWYCTCLASTKSLVQTPVQHCTCVQKYFLCKCSTSLSIQEM
jgi:hypothetical protein